MVKKRQTVLEILDGFANGDVDVITDDLFESIVQVAADSVGFRWYVALSH